MESAIRADLREIVADVREATRGARFQVLSGGRGGAALGVAEAPRPTIEQRRFGLEALAGRFVELSGGNEHAPVSSLALNLVVEAQRRGENTAWVATSDEVFYICDARAAGVDLQALPIIIPPRKPQTEPALLAGRAVSHLLRSGSFGLVVLDLTRAPEHERNLPLPLQSRLTMLAQKHGTLLLALTVKGAREPSLGSLVSLHAHVSRLPSRDTRDGYRHFEVVIDVAKDKRTGPDWSQRIVFRGPEGCSVESASPL